MADNNQRRNLDKALGQFIDSLRLFVPAMLKEEYGEAWDEEYYKSLGDRQQEDWERQVDAGKNPIQLIDFHNLGIVAIKQKNVFKTYFQREANNLPTIFNQIADARHMVAHYDDWDKGKANLAFAQMANLAKMMMLDDLAQEIQQLQVDKEVTDQIEERNELVQNEAINEPAKAWFNNVKPHLDIRQGNLDESVFAADLAEVALGTGRAVYQNFSLFFEKTYFTSGLTNIANRVLKGLNGEQDGENRVISLQTGFGGGKTHTLISLYHLAKAGKKIKKYEEVQNRLNITPNFEKANIAVFTNTTNDPTQGRKTREGIHIKTLWGELAYQLGGERLYGQIKENDEQRTAPKGLFKKILNDAAPCLILIDELADYCVSAAGITVGQSSLSDQTISFMQELTESISRVPNCVGVVTLPASVGEVANSPQAESILMSLKDRVARVGADTKPVADEEIFEVIRHRLFEGLGDRDQIENVISRYETLYQENWTELPSIAKKTEYSEMMRRSYPFHPELINILRNKWASNPKFQRTRGVLRILASIVSDLWKRRNNLSGNHFLIHSNHIEIANLDTITGEIKKLYGNGYDAVITSDISGISSNAYQIDEEKPSYRENGLATGISTVVFLNSFGSEGVNRGISVKFIKLHMISPDGFNHNMINGALDELQARAYYLYYTQKAGSDQKYWFHTKPNLNILVNKTVNDIKNERIEKEIVNFLESSKSRIRNFNVIIDPQTDIPEQHSPTLVILHPSIYKNGNDIFDETIQKIATKKGNSDRVYRNTILFLAISSKSRYPLYSAIKEYLSCLKVREEYITQLENDQQQELKIRISESKNNIEHEIIASYNHVYKYKSKDGISHIELREFANDFALQVSNKLYERLLSEEWLLESVGYNALVRNNLVPDDGKPLQAKVVYDAFRRYDDKYMIKDADAIETSINKYCYNGQFAVGSRKGDNWQKMYYKEPIPYFSVEDEIFWLVSESDYTDWKKSQSQEDTEGSGAATTEPTKEIPAASGTAKEMAKGHSAKPVIPQIEVRGVTTGVGFNQLFNSFINPLRKNNVQIEFKIIANSNPDNPITESSPEFKAVKESAAQLGYELRIKKEDS